MIDGSEKCKHQLTFERQNLRVDESVGKREKQKNNVRYFLFPSVLRYTPSPQLELSGPADFGVTVADGKVLRKEIFVLNEGSLPGEFKIRYTGNEPITIMPSGGIVRPGAKQGVKVNKNYTVSYIRLFHITYTLELPGATKCGSYFLETARKSTLLQIIHFNQ